MSACAREVGLGVRTLERWRKSLTGEDGRAGPRTVPHNKLSEHEERRLLDVLNSPEHRDLSPRQVIPALAERGTYVASEATAYRVLRRHGMLHHRQDSRPQQHRRPRELVAQAPNQVLCWDITYLRSPVIGQFFYLYLVTDIFSRRIVAATVYETEDDAHASRLFASVIRREKIPAGQATLHSDNGPAMKGATLKATLERLGVVSSFSRPRVSDDNPYVESLFGTMKSRVGYPRKPFSSVEEAQVWVDRFVAWYDNEHRHSALNWVTPNARHTGADLELLRRRRETYERARARNPGRWTGAIRNCAPAPAVTLNPVREATHTARAA
jgi:transposase InsO family protein